MAEYLRNADFELLIRRYRRNKKKHGEELGRAFLLLATRVVQQYLKSEQTFCDQDDVIQEAVLTCFLKVRRFDPSKGKAFNYFTTLICNVFNQKYRSGKNYFLKICKLKDRMIARMASSERSQY